MLYTMAYGATRGNRTRIFCLGSRYVTITSVLLIVIVYVYYHIRLLLVNNTNEKSCLRANPFKRTHIL